MQIGFSLPQLGAAATPQAVVEVAQRAEALGYDSLWVWERLLRPVNPQTPHLASPDGPLPENFKYAWDPLSLLTFAAAHTKRVALGTCVLNMPYYNPVLLARQLSTLDVLSGGRLRLAFGLGWSKDEFDAVGVSMRERGRRADEFLRVIKAIWTTDPVEFHGEFYQVPRSIIGLKPIQKPHPPIYLAAYAPAALNRAARLANGWTPVGIPLEGMARMIPQLREMARAAGRDPAALEVIVRANIHVTPRPLGPDRWIFGGSLDQIKADIDRVRALNVDEVFFDASFSPDVTNPAAFLAYMDRIRQML